MKQKSVTRKGRKSRSGASQKSKDAKVSSGSSDTLNYEDSIKNLDNPPKSGGLSEHSVTDSVKIAPEKSRRPRTSFLAGSAPEFSGSWSSEVEGQKDIRTPKKSFFEDGGSSVLPMATGYFPKPKEGQSLTSFLSSGQFARANAELDRENAHFSISEAMIAAIEQVSCSSKILRSSIKIH